MPAESPPVAASAVPEGRVRTITTPEGASLPFTIATVGDRLAAFLIDGVIITVVSLVVGFAVSFTALAGMPYIGMSAGLLASFILRNFYFIFFEVLWGGRTAGKRALYLRVISRHGGPLRAEAVFARNLTRELELFLPLMALLAPRQVIGDAPGWTLLLATLWLFAFALLPLFNKDRLRIGDIIGGTVVVRAPRSVLLPDLASGPSPSNPHAADGDSAPRYAFTQEQLDIYGIHELQTLEDLLRRYEENRLDFQVLVEVCEKIKTKVEWPAEDWQVPVLEFLQAFYRAQRGRLERKMLFGQRQERKRR